MLGEMLLTRQAYSLDILKPPIYYFQPGSSAWSSSMMGEMYPTVYLTPGNVTDKVVIGGSWAKSPLMGLLGWLGSGHQQ